MLWRNSILFPIVVFPSLAVLTLVGAFVLYPLPPTGSSPFLHYGFLLLGCFSPVMAFFFGRQLQGRFAHLSKYIESEPSHPDSSLPPLRNENEDEVSVVEKEVRKLVARLHEEVRVLQSEEKKLADIRRGRNGATV